MSLETRTILLLNAPPASGKDTVALEIESCARRWRSGIERYHHLKYSAPIKAACAAFFGLKPQQVLELEGDKETPRAELLGHTWRQAQIAFGEKYARAVYGTEVFAQLLVQQVNRYYLNYVVSDCGFPVELEVFGRHHFAADRVVVVHIERSGCDYSRDSRNWVGQELPLWLQDEPLAPGAMVRATLVNNSTRDVLRERVNKLLGALHG